MEEDDEGFSKCIGIDEAEEEEEDDDEGEEKKKDDAEEGMNEGSKNLETIIFLKIDPIE